MCYETSQVLEKMSLWRYMVFKVALHFYRLLNVFSSLIFGFSLYSGHTRERVEMDTNYDRSAQLMKIKWKIRKFELEGPLLKRHFLLRFVFVYFTESHATNQSQKSRNLSLFPDTSGTPIQRPF